MLTRPADRTRQPDNEILSARSASDEKERMIIRPSFEVMTRFEHDSFRDIALFIRNMT